MKRKLFRMAIIDVMPSGGRTQEDMLRGFFLTPGSIIVFFLILSFGLSLIGWHFYRVFKEKNLRIIQTEQLLEQKLKTADQLASRYTALAGMSSPLLSFTGFSPDALNDDLELGNESQQKLSQALTFFMSDRMKEAAEQCQKLINSTGIKSETKTNAQIIRIAALVKQVEFREALKTAREAAENNSDNLVLTLAACDLFLEAGDIKSAKSLSRRFDGSGTIALEKLLISNLALAENNPVAAEPLLLRTIASGDWINACISASSLCRLYALHRSDYHEAAKYAQMVKVLAPGTQLELESLALCDIASGAFPAAEKKISQLEKSSESLASAISLRLTIAERSGNSIQAKELSERLAELSPGLSKNRLFVSSLRKLNMLRPVMKETSKKGKKAVAASTDLPPEMISKARNLMATKKFAEAALYIDECSAKGFSGTDGWLLKSAALIQIEHIPEARQALEEALAISPDDSRVLMQAASLSNALNDRLAAEKFYARILESEPQNLNAIRGLAFTYINSNLNANAIACATRGLRASPADPALLTAMVMAQFKSGNFAEALAACETYVQKRHPQSAQLFYVMAVCRRKLGASEDEVLSLLTQAVNAGPTYAPALNDYVDSLASHGKADEAEKLLDGLLSVSGESAYALDTAARVKYVLGKHTEALEFLEKALQKEPKNPLILMHYASIFNKQGNVEKAATFRAKALDATRFDLKTKNKLIQTGDDWQ